jgi:hypothetical protein
MYSFIQFLFFGRWKQKFSLYHALNYLFATFNWIFVQTFQRSYSFRLIESRNWISVEQYRLFNFIISRRSRKRQYYSPPVQSAICHCLPTLSCLTHATPHSIFSQSEHVEASSSPAQLYYKYGKKYSFYWLLLLLPYILNFQWNLKTYPSLPPCLITASTVTSITQILRLLRSFALLLPLSLTLKRLHSYRTPRMGHALLKLTNYSL